MVYIYLAPNRTRLEKRVVVTVVKSAVFVDFFLAGPKPSTPAWNVVTIIAIMGVTVYDENFTHVLLLCY